jgi:calcineurin-like phosphoesterase family protein
MPKRKRIIRSGAPIARYRPVKMVAKTRRGLEDVDLVYVRGDFGYYEEEQDGKLYRHLYHIPSGRNWWTTRNHLKAKKAVREAAQRIPKKYRVLSKKERDNLDLEKHYGSKDAYELIYGTLYSAYKADLMDKKELDNKMAALKTKKPRITQKLSKKAVQGKLF